MRLLNLAHVLRSAGLVVYEQRGRSRVTGGEVPWQEMVIPTKPQFKGPPNHIMIHHTASKTSVENDIQYCNYNSSIRPITQLMLDRTGAWHVLSSGPANTNGRGSAGAWTNIVPDNEMNDWAINVEICNNGIGEPYPKVQQDSLVVGVRALMREFNILSHFVRGHYEWTDRKIDPSGPCRWAPQGGKWNMPAFRNELAFTPLRKKMNYLETPVRIFDSRNFFGKSEPFRAGEHTMQMGHVAQVPVGAEALAITVTAVPIGYPGFVTLWSGREPRSNSSNLNYSNTPVGNTTAVKLFSNSFKIYVKSDVHLVFDVIGWQ